MYVNKLFEENALPKTKRELTLHRNHINLMFVSLKSWFKDFKHSATSMRC